MTYGLWKDELSHILTKDQLAEIDRQESIDARNWHYAKPLVYGGLAVLAVIVAGAFGLGMAFNSASPKAPEASVCAADETPGEPQVLVNLETGKPDAKPSIPCLNASGKVVKWVPVK